MKIVEIASSLVKSLPDEIKDSFLKKVVNKREGREKLKLKKLFLYLRDTSPNDKLRIADLTLKLGFNNNKEFRKTCNNLIFSIETFLINLYLETTPLVKQEMLYKELAKRESRFYKKIVRLNIEKRIQVESFSNCTLEQYKSYASLCKYFHLDTDITKIEAQQYLIIRKKCINTFYWINKLALLIDKAIRAITLPEEIYLLNDLPTLPQNVIESCYHNKTLLVYLCIYNLALDDFNSQELNNKIIYTEKHSKEISSKNGERIFNFLTEVVAYQKNKKTTNLTNKDLYEVFKLGLKNKWSVQEDNLMYLSDFFNILVLAWNGKDLSFLEKINRGDYEEITAKEHKSIVFIFSKSYIHFLKEEWDEILELISKSKEIKIDKDYQLFFLINRNVLKIKTLFQILLERIGKGEANPYDIEKHLNNYYEFIRRNYKKEPVTKDLNHKFVFLLKQFYKCVITRENNLSKVSSWLSSLEKERSIEKDWLYHIGNALKEKHTKIY